MATCRLCNKEIRQAGSNWADADICKCTLSDREAVWDNEGPLLEAVRKAFFRRLEGKQAWSVADVKYIYLMAVADGIGDVMGRDGK